jgi:hypothetical protein
MPQAPMVAGRLAYASIFQTLAAISSIFLIFASANVNH